MTRTIRELVETEVIYFISPLIDELLRQEKYREEFYHLTTSTDWDEAEKAIAQNICIVQRDVDNLWGVYDKDNEYYTVEPTHENKIEAIKQYFNDVNWDLCDYSCEVCEWWLVSEWLLNKLEDKGETVERDFYGLTVWGRTTTGQSIWCDWIIQEIYNDLQHKQTLF